ncbi:MAG: DsbA family protein [Alphaproteobacteria bacterium]|nr:DsbA family protein [Alphaproteobacteria bacterium]
MYKKLGFGAIFCVATMGIFFVVLHNSAPKAVISPEDFKAAQEDGARHEYSELDVVFGDLEAPIKIVEYTSLNCGHCAHFHQIVFPELKKKYIEKGEVVLIVKHFPIDGQALDAASLLANFPKFRQVKLMDELFSKQEEWMGENHLDKLSSLCNISPEECKKMATDLKTSDAILSQQLIAGKKLKISATPTFVINGRILPYAPTLEEIEQIIGVSSQK